MCGCCSKKDKQMNSEKGGSSTRNPNDPAPAGPSSQSGSGLELTPSPTINRNYDWDALYEDTNDSSAADEPRPSVLSYLWSQLKIGMDLTKITLPTYILERRSLLEMYADFFAHPDMFVAIADVNTPQERIIAVAKWYLASFHCSRKSDVAKKPYNPILGEVFFCWWKSVGRPIPKAASAKSVVNSEPGATSDPHPSPANEPPPNPVPRFNTATLSDATKPFFNAEGNFLPEYYNAKNTLMFFGEQVSHHPPISAFYAEHVDKGISVNAHIWTKSKFMGLSVGVHNIGEATLRVKTTAGTTEEYMMGFPSGYARSVLSVPWVELGGDVQITCPQTGYNCAIEFCTKTMLGNDKNRVITKIYRPGEKKPFMVIDGLWNDVMSLKVPEGSRTPFLDIKSLRIQAKETRHVVDQELFESRRLWKDVTKALKFKEVDAASAAKKVVEDRQRLEAKDREASNSVWRPRLFEKSGDGWIFTQPLDKRLRYPRT